MQCFILAGGFATRLWPVTETRAKPLLPLAGKPILTHLVEKIPDDVFITVSTNAVFTKDMEKWMKTLPSHNIEIYTEDAKHDNEKLGALGALRQWIEEKDIDEDILLLAGDNYIGFEIQSFLDAFRGNPLLAAYDIGDLEQAKRFGTVIMNNDNTVKGFEEKPQEPKSTIVSTGCYVLPKQTLPILDAYAKEHPDNIGGIFEEFLRKNMTIDTYVFDELWRDIGSFGTYLQTHIELLHETNNIDTSASVDEQSVIGSNVSLGAKTIVKNSTLKNCLIFGNTTIDDCILENCIIDTDCKLRGIDLSNKMIRAKTKLQR